MRNMKILITVMVFISIAAMHAYASIPVAMVEIRGTTWNDTSLNNMNYWNPKDFPGFFYDINDNLGAENLRILQMDLAGSLNSQGWWENRAISKSNLIYSTTAQAKKLNVVRIAFNNNLVNATAAGLNRTGTGQAFENGNYYILGWQGDAHVAINGKVDKLSRLVLEQGAAATDKKTLTVNETWDIGGGWALTVSYIDYNVTPRQVKLFLTKDGIKKNETLLYNNKIYTYVENNFANETDIPLFVTYIDSIFHGSTVDLVQLRYTLAISTNATQIKSGDTYGKFRDAEVTNNSKDLKLKNSDTTINLIKDTTVDLIGNLKFKVAGSNVLRFYPVVTRDQPGVYEVRGTVWNDSSWNNVNKWNPYNFAGFFYDLKDNLGNEALSILQMNLAGMVNSPGWSEQRTISKSNMTYATTAQSRMLKVVSDALGMSYYNWDAAIATNKGLEQCGSGKAFDGGNYYIMGWQGEKYMAINGKVDKPTKLILEQGSSVADKKTLTVGETWKMGDGWALTANSIDAKASPRQVWFTLSKDGVAKDDKVVTSGGSNDRPIYTYVEKSLCGELDVPMFVTYVDSIFAGTTTDMVQLRYTWLISSNCTEIRSGDTYGIFRDAEVTNSSKDLRLKNSDSTVNLSRGTIIELMKELKVRVADSDTLRFYPFVTYEVILPPPPPGPFDKLKFEPGVWNLVSVPKTLENSSVDAAFVNLSSDPNNIKWSFNNATGWVHPSSIDPLRGYWVYNNASTPIYQQFRFKNMSGPNVPPSMTLKAGWNLIGHTSTMSMPVDSALISIRGKYSHLLTYSPVEGWKMYIVGNPSLQQFSTFEPGKGYWIFMTEDAIYAAVDI